MAAPASIGATYKVPDWAVKNKEILLSAARCVPPPARSPLHILALPYLEEAITKDEQVSKAAISMSVLSEETSNGIMPPTEPPGADYFKDVGNHPDVLSTIISTARVTVGFTPDVNGKDLTGDQLRDYVNKFIEFLEELDKYDAFVVWRKTLLQTFQSDSIDCNLLINALTSVLTAALGMATSGPAFDALVESTSNLITTAVGYVSESGKATIANFEMVGLPKSNQVGDPNPYKDPISAATFTTTTLSQQQSVQESNITTFAKTYQLRSLAVIACADQLAGCTITGTLALRDYINSALPS